MSNFSYHPSKDSIQGFKSRDQILKEKGWVFCPKHPAKWYDPKKFDQCYICHLEAEKK